MTGQALHMRNNNVGKTVLASKPNRFKARMNRVVRKVLLEWPETGLAILFSIKLLPILLILGMFSVVITEQIASK